MPSPNAISRLDERRSRAMRRDSHPFCAGLLSRGAVSAGVCTRVRGATVGTLRVSAAERSCEGSSRPVGGTNDTRGTGDGVRSGQSELGFSRFTTGKRGITDTRQSSR